MRCERIKLYKTTTLTNECFQSISNSTFDGERHHALIHAKRLSLPALMFEQTLSKQLSNTDVVIVLCQLKIKTYQDGQILTDSTGRGRIFLLVADMRHVRNKFSV